MPSLAGFLLLPLLGGFLFLEIFERTRFHFREQEGHRLFLFAATAGLCLFVSSRLGILIVDETASGLYLRAVLKKYADFSFSGAGIGALLLGVGLALLLNIVLGWKWLAKKLQFKPGRVAALRRVAEKSDELLLLLLEAPETRNQLLVSLDSGKAYVGYVLETAHLAPDLPYIKLLPTMSGYRTDELELSLTTVYAPTIDLMAKLAEGPPKETAAAWEKELKNLQVVLKRDKIVSASFFNSGLYQSHEAARRNKAESARREEERREQGRFNAEAAAMAEALAPLLKPQSEPGSRRASRPPAPLLE